MGNGARRDFGRRNIVVSLIRGKKPGLLEQRDRATYRAANIIQVEVWRGVLGLKTVWRKISGVDFIIKRPRSQRGVAIVVKRRSVIVRAAAFCTDANVGDARVFRAEIGGQKI